MNARVRPSRSKKELKAIQEIIDEQVQEGIVKAQWLWILAFHDELGIGAERIFRVMDSLHKEILPSYEGYRKDDVADEILLRRLKQIGIMEQESRSIYPH